MFSEKKLWLLEEGLIAALDVPIGDEAKMKSIGEIIAETTVALGSQRIAVLQGRPMRGVDWLKCAKIIKERKPDIVVAGLKEDWGSTCCVVYEGGEIVDTMRTGCLESTWATPVIEVDGEIIECSVNLCDRSRKDWSGKEYGYWPDFAVEVLKGIGG
jgi:hypothetical protein